jgi:hypothetical protein
MVNKNACIIKALLLILLLPFNNENKKLGESLGLRDLWILGEALQMH